MRGLLLFVVGLLVGLAGHAAIAQNQSQNRGFIGLEHVGISVPNLDKAVDYYTKTMGFPEAFRNSDDKGNTTVFVQVSRNSFVELQAANAQRPPGISHFCVAVENMAAATAMLKDRGAKVSEAQVGGSKALVAHVTDPNGVRIDLIELTPDSQHRKAMEQWK